MLFNLKALFICSFFASETCYAVDNLYEVKEGDASLTYDLSSLLRRTGLNFEEEMPHFPLVSCFKMDEFELWYIATQHAFNKEHLLFNLINNQIETFNPDLVILEGFQNDQISDILASKEAG